MATVDEPGHARRGILPPPPPGPTASLPDLGKAQLSGPWRFAVPGVVLAAVAGASVYTYVVDPNSSGAFPQCPFRAVTGLDCPGCGGLRCVHALLHGDVAAAADHNLLTLLLLPLTTLVLLRWVLVSWGMSLPEVRLPRVFAWALPVAFFGFWVLRNIPWEPLPYLGSGAG